MYKTIKISIFISFCFFLCSCTKENGSQVYVRIYNNTGKEIKRLHIGSCSIGKMDVNGIYEGKLDHITLDGKWVQNDGKAKIDGEDYTFYGSDCGTMFRTYYVGFYEIEIELVETYSNKNYLNMHVIR